MSEIRYRTKQFEYTKIQRLRIWWRGIIDAIRSIPDTHYSEFVQVRKGEDGYEDAPWACVEDPNPLRFTIENGKYVHVNPETMSSEPNPEWHDA